MQRCWSFAGELPLDQALFRSTAPNDLGPGTSHWFRRCFRWDHKSDAKGMTQLTFYYPWISATVAPGTAMHISLAFGSAPLDKKGKALLCRFVANPLKGDSLERERIKHQKKAASSHDPCAVLMSRDWSQVQEDCPLRYIVPALSSPACMVSAGSNRPRHQYQV